MPVLYIDELFLTNTLIDYLTLLSSAYFSGLPFKRLRLLFSALLGGSYAIAAFFFPPLECIPAKIGMSLLLILTAFGYVNRASLFSMLLRFTAVSLLTGGTVLLVSLYFPIYSDSFLLILTVCLVTVTVIRFFSGNGRHTEGRGAARLKISYQGRHVDIGALVDSGNMLREQITGSPVIVAEYTAIRPLLDTYTQNIIDVSDLSDPVSMLMELSNHGLRSSFRLLPFSSVGSAKGLLLAFRPENAVLDGKKLPRPLIAISPNSIGENGSIRALVPLL